MAVMDCPGDESFEFEGVEYEDSDEPSSNGTLWVPAATKYMIPDGQHRALAMIVAALEGGQLMANETLPVMLTIGSTAALKKKIFLDINQNAVKPNISLITLFDDKDIHAEAARELLLGVKAFEGRTSLESSNPAEGDLFTLKALKDVAKKARRTWGDATPQNLQQLWDAIARYHPDWQVMPEGVEEIEDLKRSKISFLAITLVALTWAACLQYEKDPEFNWTTALSLIDWGVDNPDYEGMIRFGGDPSAGTKGKIVKNAMTVRSLTDYIIQKTS